MSNYNGGGNFRGPAPRPILDEIHQLNPVAEACAQMENAAFKHMKQPGDNISNNTFMAQHNGISATMIEPRAILAKRMQMGIPHDHECYPVVKRFPARYASDGYYPMWNIAVRWEHHEDFRYIPGYSRYVCDFQGNVKNAYNGKAITPLNGFTIELVPDGPKNAVRKAPISLLISLTWSKLPEDFICYGFGNFSHELRVNKEAEAVQWVAKTPIVSKQGEQVDKWPCMDYFLNCCVEKFEDRTAMGDIRWKGMRGNTMSVAGYMIKEGIEWNPGVTGDVSIKSAEGATEAPAGTTESTGSAGGDFSGDDFAF